MIHIRPVAQSEIHLVHAVFQEDGPGNMLSVSIVRMTAAWYTLSHGKILGRWTTGCLNRPVRVMNMFGTGWDSPVRSAYSRSPVAVTQDLANTARVDFIRTEMAFFKSGKIFASNW